MKKEKLLEILKELHPEIDFETEKRLIDSKILDSMDIIELISEIAVAFEIIVPAHEIIPENFNSIDALFHLLQELE